eukprot:CAMPEP_0194251322 /NCGR_PEP_ID=MMETSP0158-20130606/25181_1 /TAXON_ID=33649 /ORGANISM="Thalassionema nitzschioides, Strain L26-B" /LENGTH=490 /DNA_ID=CAMNT_0038988429 /DNA_START=32 /DNA_END=1501 /DNA_ORIENTATION=-
MTTTSAQSSSSSSSKQQQQQQQHKKRPNFIVCQPDDLPFFEEWTPPPHFPKGRDMEFFPSNNNNDDGGGGLLPNMERLRTQGLQLMQAYTTSPMCGTSRYSTITGRYPSRSSFNKLKNQEDDDISDIVIPKTKLLDTSQVVDGQDCSENNLAAVLQQNGYRTGMVGKWHLGNTDRDNYDYDAFREHVQGCGFDYAEALYAENLWDDIYWTEWHSHNMEYMTERAVNFITTTSSQTEEEEEEEPFFLYFNPTVPHEGADVYEALTEYPCTWTPGGTLDQEPRVPGMTSDKSCQDYRQTVLDRANGKRDNRSLGAIWLDDSIGSLLQVLEETNQLDNTFFLFQMDHGQEGKVSLWEPGTRIAQFVHYPDGGFARQQQQQRFDGMVSVIDIAPTILDYAGVVRQDVYDMDGISWRRAVEEEASSSSTLFFKEQRCLFFEFQRDRAVRCGCYKYMELHEDDIDDSYTYRYGRRHGLDYDNTKILSNLCYYEQND